MLGLSKSDVYTKSSTSLISPWKQEASLLKEGFPSPVGNGMSQSSHANQYWNLTCKWPLHFQPGLDKEI